MTHDSAAVGEAGVTRRASTGMTYVQHFIFTGCRHRADDVESCWTTVGLLVRGLQSIGNRSSSYRGPAGALGAPAARRRVHDSE